ncbi:hypothetical protein Tco_0831801 [Tanacetum coccineum]
MRKAHDGLLKLCVIPVEKFLGTSSFEMVHQVFKMTLSTAVPSLGHQFLIMFEQSSSKPCSSTINGVSENNTSAPFLNVQRRLSTQIKPPSFNASFFMAMTSDHNRSELRIHDHSNEPSSSKLVPKVVPLATIHNITTRVGITIPPSYSNAEDNRLGINPMIQPEPEDLPKDNPKLEIAVLRTSFSGISLVFTMTNGNPSSVIIKQHCGRSNGGNDNLNPIQMLNLRRHTI